MKIPVKKRIKDRSFLKQFAWLSVGAALATIVLKTIAYLLTNSISLMSDAAESLVNLAGALMALWMLTIAARPEDEDHTWGHSKAEYFSSGAEGTMILLASLSIGFFAVQRLLNPRNLEQINLGLIVNASASVINLAVSLFLSRAAKKYNSITLEANSKHLMTDVFTSAGVIGGIIIVSITGLNIIDPILALLVAGNIVISGVSLVRKSVHGLMDTIIPETDIEKLKKVCEPYTKEGISFHAIRTRQAGSRKFISMHVLVPGSWSVHQGHRLLEEIELKIRQEIPESSILTHLESLDDPASWDDLGLDRDE
jgi:cation diffusion facilitator family transporter